MTGQAERVQVERVPRKTWRGWPVLTLLVLSPFVAELQFGSTALSDVGGFLLEIGLYGSGAVAIRELARRSGRGWPAMLLLGFAYAVVEEGLTEPTWFNPGLFQHPLGVVAHVNTVYALFNAGYHAVWSILLPIVLTEVLFPRVARDPWLGRTGLVVCAVLYAVFAAGMGVLFYLVFGPVAYHQPIHARPVPMLVAAVLGALAVVAAFRLPARAGSSTSAPGPWLVFLTGLAGGLLWFGLLIGSDSAGTLPQWTAVPAVLVELAVPVAAAAVARRWTAAASWSDRHRVALIAGAMLPQMLPGYQWLHAPGDIAFKIVLNVAMLALLATLARRRGPADRVA